MANQKSIQDRMIDQGSKLLLISKALTKMEFHSEAETLRTIAITLFAHASS